MFKPKITKEEVNQLPTCEFTGKIVLVETLGSAEEAIRQLNNEKIVGIDTETRPSFKRGINYKVSLLQISTENTCYLFRLNKIGFPDALIRFLSNESVMKVGLSLRDDFNGLKKQKKFKPANYIDIQEIAKQYGILELSLQKIYAILFGKKISKAQRLTNWENPVLSEQQMRYAATDAWATLEIHLCLSQQKKLTNEEVELLVTNENNLANDHN